MTVRFHRKILALIGAAIAITWPAAGYAADQFRWVQYGPAGLEARVATEKGACPQGLIDGQTVAMSVRSTPGPDYPVLVCSMPIPASAKDVRVAGFPMALPKPQVNRILVIGDTGCRLKGKQVQSCNDIAEWPFRIGADISTEFKPDLVLHVGDYHYRETACPLNNNGCAGTPFGDTWDVWREDFFVPAQSLLAAAPWILVRGNHEECDRGGKGWARTLDPYPWSADAGATGCLGLARPFLVDLGDIKLGVVDVSTAEEASVNEQQVAWYKDVFSSVIASAGGAPMWLTFHRPVWVSDGSSGKNKGGDNRTLAAALKDTLKPNVSVILSGHHHVFEAMSYEEDLPAALVSGNGGDDLSPNVPVNPIGLAVNGSTVKAGITRPGIFGFAMLERMTDGSGRWSFTGYDTHGKQIGRCLVEGRQLACD
jgi:predicted phosphodiesterase